MFGVPALIAPDTANRRFARRTTVNCNRATLDLLCCTIHALHPPSIEDAKHPRRLIRSGEKNLIKIFQRRSAKYCPLQAVQPLLFQLGGNTFRDYLARSVSMSIGLSMSHASVTEPVAPKT